MSDMSVLLKICHVAILFILMGIINFIGAQNIQTDTLYSDTSALEMNSYFSFDISYTNNNLTSKNIYASNTSALLSDISFYHHSGLWVSALPVTNLNVNIPSYDVTAMTGYQHFFNNGIDINTYYVYHYYTGDSAFMGIEYTHSLNLSIGYNYEGLYVYTDAYSLWGNSENYFADLGLGYYKDFYLGTKKQNYISIFPLINLSFGTDYWVYSDLTTRELIYTKVSLYRNGYSWDTFDMQSFDFMIPIGFTYKNITSSISYLYSVPTQKYKLLGWENQSGIMLSVNYLLNINK